jgi:hypothetical protein
MTPPRAVSVFRDADRIHPNTFRDGGNRHFMAGMAGIANKFWCTETTSLSTNSTCCLRQRCHHLAIRRACAAAQRQCAPIMVYSLPFGVRRERTTLDAQLVRRKDGALEQCIVRWSIHVRRAIGRTAGKPFVLRATCTRGSA